jgi:RNase H-fold protein (predicted Holliday junction resolvase)
MNYLVFIDTNILLDFYRIRSKDLNESLLSHIDKNHDKIITTMQVEMEFKKNRQQVILESINRIKQPDWSGITPPAFLSTAQPVKTIKRNREELEQQLKKLKKRLEVVLGNPGQNDPVYQTSQRLFKNSSKLNLNRDKRLRKVIRSRALHRFMLGYPPRKNDDISIGDSVNWEWILHCAEEMESNIVIVSRDQDFGVNYSYTNFLNDALLQEFHERISKKRKIVLTEKLTYAFKIASVAITKTEERQEEALVAEVSKEKIFYGGSPCQMSGQECPACHKGVVDVAPGEQGVICNKCGLFIPA